jgi:tryptophanase
MTPPSKTRELHSHHFDSTIWNDFRFRNDDIVIATYAKSGTTWMLKIIAQMLFGGDPAPGRLGDVALARLARPSEGDKAPHRRGANASPLC